MALDLTTLTPEELGQRWRSFCRRHDALIDSAPMGDERIYFAQQELNAIEREFRDRGLNYHDFVRDEPA